MKIFLSLSLSLSTKIECWIGPPILLYVQHRYIRQPLNLTWSRAFSSRLWSHHNPRLFSLGLTSYKCRGMYLFTYLGWNDQQHAQWSKLNQARYMITDSQRQTVMAGMHACQPKAKENSTWVLYKTTHFART